MLRALTRSLVFIATFTCLSINASNGAKPNIIYVLADDMGVGDVTSLNPQGKIRTPHLDAMAANGLQFTNMHTSSAVCTPTRYGIITGRYSWRTHMKKGVLNGHSDALIPKQQSTVASMLKQQGYATAAIGKWHLGMDWVKTNGANPKPDGSNIDPTQAITNGPRSNGFDYFFGISASLNMSPHAYIENEHIKGDLIQLTNKSQLKQAGLKGAKPGWVDKGFKQNKVMTNFVDKTIDWITAHTQRSPQQPFFTYLALNSPHGPIVPDTEFQGSSRLSEHGDFVVEIDHHIGRLVAALDKLNLTDDTLVIFTADNGVAPGAKLAKMQQQGHYSSGPYRGLKGTLYEGGHRVPFIVQWPGKITKGKNTDWHGSTNDLYATLAEIVNHTMTADEGVDSVSFLPALSQPELTAQDRFVVYHSDAGRYAVRQGKWKLILDKGYGSRRSNPKDSNSPVKHFKNHQFQLFDMEADERESTNLAQLHPEKVERLKQQLTKAILLGRTTKGERQDNDPLAKNKPWVGVEMLNL